ncbi:MAG: hypothetical protein DLM70_03170 [Chloroflexi bacterium]|nr:MAG: hypothetical protein DLM70_03170 [Chloroflexota bacterium]
MIRLVLLLAGLALAGWFIALHGVRGVVIVLVVGLMVTLPQTRAWRWVEGQLVRLTGSRKYAYALVLAVFIVIAAVFAIGPLLP